MDTKLRSFQEFQHQLDAAKPDAGPCLNAIRRLRQDPILKILEDPEDPDTQGTPWSPWEPL